MSVKLRREAKIYLYNTGSFTTVGSLGPKETDDLVQELYDNGAIKVAVDKVHRDFADELYVHCPILKKKCILSSIFKRKPIIVEETEPNIYRVAWY